MWFEQVFKGKKNDIANKLTKNATICPRADFDQEEQKIKTVFDLLSE